MKIINLSPVVTAGPEMLLGKITNPLAQ